MKDSMRRAYIVTFLLFLTMSLLSCSFIKNKILEVKPENKIEVEQTTKTNEPFKPVDPVKEAEFMELKAKGMQALNDNHLTLGIDTLKKALLIRSADHK